MVIIPLKSHRFQVNPIKITSKFTKGAEVMRLFVGTLDGYKLDSKGRLSVPTKWRERLGKEFYMVAVTVRGCKCLTLYPVEHFESTYDAMQQGTENRNMMPLQAFLIMQKRAYLMPRADLPSTKGLRKLLLLQMSQQLYLKVKVL